MFAEDYVSFETAKFLKEKGFDEPTLGYYLDDKDKLYFDRFSDDWNSKHVGYISAPTLQRARKWLREKHHLHIEIRITNHSISMVNVIKYYWVMCNTETGRWCDESTVYNVRAFDKSEEAEEDAISIALKTWMEIR